MLFYFFLLKSANIATDIVCVLILGKFIVASIGQFIYKKHSHVTLCMAVFIKALHLYSVSLKLPSLFLSIFVLDGCYNDAVFNLFVYCISFYLYVLGIKLQ